MIIIVITPLITDTAKLKRPDLVEALCISTACSCDSWRSGTGETRHKTHTVEPGLAQVQAQRLFRRLVSQSLPVTHLILAEQIFFGE